MSNSLPPDHARCWDCEYSLRAIVAGHCPECGRRFDPRDDGSMKLNRGRKNFLIRFLLKPPGLLLHLAAIFATLYPLWEARNPGAWATQLMAVVLWVPVPLLTVIRL